MDTATRIEAIEGTKGNEFLGQTGRLPRPSRETHGGKPELLAAAQQRWDAAADWARENEKLRAERLARLDAERVARQTDREQQEDERFVAGLREKYMSADGTATAAEFAEDLPAIRREHRIKAALSGGADDGRAPAANAARYGGL